MAKLQLRTNVPEVIALQFTTGKEVESNFNGTEILYSLEDGRSWYVHPSVARKIDALCLGKGEPFEVTKVEAVGRKGFEYDVKHAIASAPQAAVLPSVETRQNGTTAQVVHTASQNSNSRPDPYRAQPDPMVQRMSSAYLVAIDALVDAESYAAAKGLKIAFTSEDLRTTALSVFIQASKGGF
jgi:hypothetical protein